MAKFNEALKAKREELGLSVADISERTRLSGTQLGPRTHFSWAVPWGSVRSKL